ncbi:MAG: isoprenylcysteine carboxylmethyltransferase family protein [Phycisphaerales bacterium]|nr:isoprenylcysteine carboxylmethyltransferase family protein [Phycisphaerales bacterium]
MVPAVSLLINHFDLFGTRQVWLHLRGRDYTHLPFRTPSVYRHVRHPLYVGWMIAFWATPTMTLAHLLFAIAMTAYILIAIPLEERDLIAHHGRTYLDYRRRVGGLIPRLPGGGGDDLQGATESCA